MKKLLFLAHTANLGGGGAHTVLATMGYLKSIGYQPVLICPADGEFRKRAKKLGIITYIVRFDWWIRPRYGAEEDYFKNATTNGMAVEQMVKIIKKEKPIACVTSTIACPWLAYAAALEHVPHIWFIQEHVTDPSPTFKYRIGYRDFLQSINLLSDKIFAVSHSVKNQLERGLPEFRNRDIGVLYNYVDPLVTRGKPTPMKKVFSPVACKLVMVGNIEPNKGQFDAVKAVGRLTKQGSDVDLVLVGKIYSQSYGKKIKDFIAEHKLASRIKLVGFIANPMEYITSADVSLLCSEQDAFPAVPIESLQLGTPVIGTRSGGLQEILGEDGSYGYLYKPGDIDELVQKISLFVKDTQLSSQMGERAEKYANSRFADIESLQKPLVDYLEKLSDKTTLFSIDLSPLQDLVTTTSSLGQTVDRLNKTLELTQNHVNNLEADMAHRRALEERSTMSKLAAKLSKHS